MSLSAGTRLSPPSYMTNEDEWRRKASEWMVQAHAGHLANAGTVTLLSGTVTTVLTDTRIGFPSVIAFMPTTANASAEVGGGTIFVSSQSKGIATITHANAATGDRTFKYSILG